jgi:hypothetical protein
VVAEAIAFLAVAQSVVCQLERQPSEFDSAPPRMLLKAGNSRSERQTLDSHPVCGCASAGNYLLHSRWFAEVVMFIMNPMEYEMLREVDALPPGTRRSGRIPVKRSEMRVVANRKDRRAMAKGKPSKGTGKDRRLKRNRGKKKRR